MGLEYIRKTYKVPAKRGGRVTVHNGKKGTIRSAFSGWIRVQLDGEKFTRNYHPTWKIVYEDA
jgi:hypothetical protein